MGGCCCRVVNTDVDDEVERRGLLAEDEQDEEEEVSTDDDDSDEDNNGASAPGINRPMIRNTSGEPPNVPDQVRYPIPPSLRVHLPAVTSLHQKKNASPATILCPLSSSSSNEASPVSQQ